MKTVDVIAAVLLVVGGLNWGLWGAFKFDLVATLMGSLPLMMNTVYALVGAAALYQIVSWRKIQLRWAVPARATVRS